MMNVVPWEMLLEYGMGVLALVMMYSITFNHLKGIQKTLIEILETLKADAD